MDNEIEPQDLRIYYVPVCMRTEGRVGYLVRAADEESAVEIAKDRNEQLLKYANLALDLLVSDPLWGDVYLGEVTPTGARLADENEIWDHNHITGFHRFNMEKG